MDIFLDILLKPPQPFIGLFFKDSNNIYQSTNKQSHHKILVPTAYHYYTFSLILDGGNS